MRFRAKIESARGGGHVVEVDAARAATIGAKHRSRVRGTVAGAPYRSNLLSMGGRLVMGVHKATLEAAGRSAGDTVTMTMELDSDPLPGDHVPPELRSAIRRSAAARRAWDAMAPSHRRRYVSYVTEAKRQDTRARRVARSIEQMIGEGRQG